MTAAGEEAKLRLPAAPNDSEFVDKDDQRLLTCLLDMQPDAIPGAVREPHGASSDDGVARSDAAINGDDGASGIA